MEIQKNIFVTGAGGWLGYRMVQALLGSVSLGGSVGTVQLKGKLRCLVQYEEDKNRLLKLSPALDVLVGDIRSDEVRKKFLSGAKDALIIHIAGIIHPKSVKEFFEINHQATEALLALAISEKASRFLAVSSNSPCGCNPDTQHRFDEASPYHPYMNYGLSKKMMEESVLARKNEIEVQLIRAPWFYGPEQPPRQTLFFQMIRDGKMPIVGSGGNVRSMAYVDNLCQGILLALTKDSPPRPLYWIADERAYSMNEIVDTVERLLDGEFQIPCQKKRLRLPGIAGEIATVVDASLQGLGLYHQKIHVLSEMNKNIACSIDKAKSELGYQPTVALEEGMRRSIQWVLDAGLPLRV